jgi:predicted dinucleotide-binding enzyme
MKHLKLNNKPKIGILGSGKLGVVLAQLFLKNGYEVYISGSGEPSKIALSVEVLTPRAIPLTSDEVIKESDIVILALPLGKYKTIPKKNIKNKLIVDAMNYWWEVDGDRDDLTNPQTSSSETVKQFLDAKRFVKSFNHMGYHDLFDEPKPVGATGRKALALAGDDNYDVDIVANIVNELGFDPVVAGNLSSGIKLEPKSHIFGANVSRKDLVELINKFDQTERGKEVIAARR